MNIIASKPGKILAQWIAATFVLVSISGCQTAPSKNITNDVKGTPLTIESGPSRCRQPFKVEHRKYSTLSVKVKRRLTYDYVYAIKNKIVGNWTKPAVSNRSQCKVRISQRPDGCVKQINFLDCADDSMRKTVSKAINTSSPLPRAPHPSIFDTKVSFTFKTNPTKFAKTDATRPAHTGLNTTNSLTPDLKSSDKPSQRAMKK